jgi:hypothetical protein
MIARGDLLVNTRSNTNGAAAVVGKTPYLRPDNVPRFAWPLVSRPAYENYYGQVYHRDERCCLWWRYTFLSRHGEKNVARLWAAVFYRDTPEANLFLTSIVPLAEVRTSDRGISFGEQSYFRRGAIAGDLGGRIVWNLEFEENVRSFRSIEVPLLGAVLSSSKNVSPNNNILVSGSCGIDGRTIRFDHEPGHQGHTWGTRMPQGWAWSQCNDFSRKGTVFEMVALDRGEGRSIGAMNFKWNGEDHYFNKLQHLTGRRMLLVTFEANRFIWNGRKLTFSGVDGNLRIEGSATANPLQYHLVRYTDTDGTSLYNLNDSVADLELRVYSKMETGWKHVDEVTSGAARLEFVGRSIPDSELTQPAESQGRVWTP